jgi:probable F420-dependent oxidoreductase
MASGGLDRIGAWLGLELLARSSSEAREVVAEVEELGYGALWFGEGPQTKEAFSHAAILLAASRRIVIATGIASIWAREPLTMSTAGKTLAEAFPGRFLLGMGVSHQPIVETLGHEYVRPVTRMRNYLEAMNAAEYHSPEPEPPLTRVLAALRPPMLELAGTLADGAHPYFVPPEHTRRAREILGPDKLLAPEVFALLETDPSEARRIARENIGFYLGAPNYVNNLLWLGYEEADIANGGSDALVDSIIAWGDEDAIRARVQEHFDAGADHVCVQPIGRMPGDLGLDQLRTLAPVLL